MSPLQLALLLVVGFSMSTALGPWQRGWLDRHQPGKRDDVLSVLMGDGRKIFANHFFEKADVYFHSGYYPTIFDQSPLHDTPHVAADAGAIESKQKDEKHDFMGPPRDWIDAFSRHFYPSHHTHLDEGGAEDEHDHDKHDHKDHKGHDHDDHKGHDHKDGDSHEGHDHGKGCCLEREILPWLRISAELDPNRVETYTVSSFWLRKMGKIKEAVQFLREGLRANPDSYEILVELGRLYEESRKDPERARNVWELALIKWHKREDAKKVEDQDRFKLAQILAHLGQLEENQGNLPKTIEYWEKLKSVSAYPDDIQKQIDKIKEKIATQPPK